MGIFTNLGALLRTGDTTYNGSTYSKPMQEMLDVSQSDENYLANWARSISGSGLTDAQRQANAFTASREDLAWQREMGASNTQYQRAVADMQAAGINPLMAVSNGGASVPAASSSGSVSPGNSPLNLGGLLSAISSLSLVGPQKKSLEADAAVKAAQKENIDADTARINAETEGKNIDNEVKRLTKDANVEAAKLRNLVDRSNARLLENKADESAAEVRRIAADVANKVEQAKYYEAAAILSKVNAYQITEMLPYEKAYRSAQTEAERQAALLSAAHAAYQNRLIDDGYIEALVAKETAEGSSAESKAELDAIKSAIRTGDYSKVKHQYGLTRDVLSTIAILLDNFNPLNGILK